ncbi:alpha/beta fold hydrolase [Sphingopyxis sp.]|uniref:alpha/beta fold hydrolase n=1 Tax=Sphingopyxis sp. TaxID=1908224 RepID=UPI00261EF4DA|nr:alpha/beta fold hydrolase [Sphingopyxis sp.]MCW0199420.1 alpha/beta hydrolase [Sphingopyxis sp.]
MMRMPDYMKIGDGPITIFLLHGGYGSKDYWVHEISALVGRGYRVVAWDAPGYGLSPLPADYSIEMVAESATHLIAELGTEKNIIIGHSMGGIVGPKVAQLIPDRIHAVVISASIAALAQGGEDFARDFIEKRIPPLRQVRTLAEAAMPLLKSMFAPTSSGPAVDLVLDIAGKTPSETFIQAMLAIQRYEGVPVVQALEVPVLCVGGRHDPVAQPHLVEQTAALIPGAKVRIFENAGHYPFAEVADAFNAALFDFLDRNGLAP